MFRTYHLTRVEGLEELIHGSLPLGFRRGPLRETRWRDLYLDTPDDALRRASASCRLRVYSGEGDALLSLSLPSLKDGGERRVFDAQVSGGEFRDALSQPSEPLRQLQKLVDPESVRPLVVIDVDRLAQQVWRRRWFGSRFEMHYDTAMVLSDGIVHSFCELGLRPARAGHPSPEQFAAALEERFRLRGTRVSKLDRARSLIASTKDGPRKQRAGKKRRTTVLAVSGGRIALRYSAGQLSLPVRKGGGAKICQQLLRNLVGTAPGESSQLDTIPARTEGRELEVWLSRFPERTAHARRHSTGSSDSVGMAPDLSGPLAAARLPAAESPGDQGETVWLPLGELCERIGCPGLRDRALIAAFASLARSELLVELLAAPDAYAPNAALPPLPPVPGHPLHPDKVGPDHFINGEISQIEFNTRVLQLAEDPRTPLLERFRFLAIFTRNTDELFMVRVGALKRAIAEGDTDAGPDGLNARDQLDLISIRTRLLILRKRRCLEEQLVPALAKNGTHILGWKELSREQKQQLRSYFDEQIFPLLTPQAMTISPGHPFPHITNLDFSLAAMLRDPRRPGAHFAHVRVPSDLPRFVAIPDSCDFIPLERLIAANYDALYPHYAVDETYAFRVTRSGDYQLDETEAVNLLDAVEREVQMRPYNAVLRVEVERAMPRLVRELLLRELTTERSAETAPLTRSDVYDVDGLLDLRGLEQLADLPRPELQYAPFTPATALDPQRSVFEILSQRDVMVHHPYESFESSVERFLVEAAQDPEVVAIKLTHYRSGTQSTILSSLLQAASRGVSVSVFVELKARFDEERNIEWARTLEEGGVHVVHGLVGLKTHCKLALVVRREEGTPKRYVHIGTGNYNAGTARIYTDLGLLSSNAELSSDVHDLFNELTGTSAAPTRDYQQLLVAPTYLHAELLRRIDREAEYARAGRGGCIRAKLNGLADRRVIEALYRASQAGVRIELIVRGICLLRPGLPGLSERIRVISVLGRFLEHARIFYFANAGDPEYFIGSADWRSRNLRRRVEVAAPVVDEANRKCLDEIFELELADPTAWDMKGDGTCARRPRSPGSSVVSVQEALIEAVGS